MPPKRKAGRALVEATVRQEAGAGADADEEEAAGAPLGSVEEAKAAAARLLELDALVKPLARESAALTVSLRDYMVGAGAALLLTAGGSVELRTMTVARVDQALIPPAVLAAARVEKTQHSLIRKPDLAGIRQGVLRGMGAAGPPPKRARRA
jgi:hypothetical protein